MREKMKNKNTPKVTKETDDKIKEEIPKDEPNPQPKEPNIKPPADIYDEVASGHFWL